MTAAQYDMYVFGNDVVLAPHGKETAVTYRKATQWLSLFDAVADLARTGNKIAEEWLYGRPSAQANWKAVSTYEPCIWLKFIEASEKAWLDDVTNFSAGTMRAIEQIYMENCKCEGGH